MIFQFIDATQSQAIITQQNQEWSVMKPPGTLNAVVNMVVTPQPDDLLVGIPPSFASGTIISLGDNQYVLTSAHQFDGLQNTNLRVVLDTNDVAATPFTPVPDVTLFIHPDYTPNPQKVALNPQAWQTADPAKTGPFGGYDVALIKLPAIVPTVFALKTIAPKQPHAGRILTAGYGAWGNGVDGEDTVIPPPLFDQTDPTKGRYKALGVNEWDGEPNQPQLQALLENTHSMQLVDFDDGIVGHSFIGSAGATSGGVVVDVMPAYGDSGGPYIISDSKVAGVQSWRFDGVASDANPNVALTYGEVVGATWLGADNLDNPGTPAVDESEETIVDWIQKAASGSTIKGAGSWDSPNTWAYNSAPGSTNDVYYNRYDSATTVVTGPSANAQIRSINIGGAGGSKQLHLQSASAVTVSDYVSVEDNGYIDVQNGMLETDMIYLASSPDALFPGQLRISGTSGAATVSVANDIIIDSGGQLDYFGTPGTTSLTASRVIVAGAGIYQTNRLGGGEIDVDWEIHGIINGVYPNVNTGTEDFVIMQNRSLTMTDGYVYTEVFRVASGASADISNTFYGSIIDAVGIDVDGTLHVDGGQLLALNADVASGGRMEVGLGGLTPYIGFGKMELSGAATLAGTLELSILDGFTPLVGDSFDILTFTSLVGAFDTVEGLGIGDGKGLLLTYAADRLTVTVHLAGDLNGDGFVGIADMNTVLGNWNAGTPPPPEVLAAIPEPGTIGLIGLGVTALLGGRRKGRVYCDGCGRAEARSADGGYASGYHTGGRSTTMRGWQTIAAAVITAAVLGVSPAGAAIALDFEPVDNSAVLTGYTTYDMRVTTDTDWTAGAMLLELGAGSLYQHEAGTAEAPHPYLLSLFPELAFDTYVVGTTVGGAGDVGGDAFAFGTNELDVSWYNLTPDEVGTTTVARLTLTDDAAGSMSIMLTAANNEKAEFDVTIAAGFDPSIAPIIQESTEPEKDWASPTYPAGEYWDLSSWPAYRTDLLTPRAITYFSPGHDSIYGQVPTRWESRWEDDTSIDSILSSRARHYDDEVFNTWKVRFDPPADDPTATLIAPEPATLLLLGMCLSVTVLRRR